MSVDAGSETGTTRSSRRAKRWRLVALGLVAGVLGGAAGLWYTSDVIAARPIQAMGGFATVAGVAVQPVDDGVKGIFASYHVPYTTAGAVEVGVFISNAGHHPAHITNIAFPDPTPQDGLISPVQTSEPLAGPFADSRQLDAFRPFTLGARESETIGWRLTMCPATKPNPGLFYSYDRFRVTYSYGGWSRTEDVRMSIRLVFQSVIACKVSGAAR